MANSNLLKEAIADAKAVRETAIANAKIALEEAFTPRLQSILSQKLTAEMEGEEEEADLEEENVVEATEEVNEEEAEEVEETVTESEEDESEEAVEETVVTEEDESEEGEEVSEGEEEEEVEETMESEEEVEETMESEEDEDELDLESIIRELEGELGEELDDEETEEVSDIASDEIESHEEEHHGEEEAADEVEESHDDESEESDDEEIDLDEILREMGYGDDEVSEDEEEEAVEENNDLEEAQAELAEAMSTIKSLKGTINEVNLLNAKLLYTNKLFRSYELTNEQKMKVVETLDRTGNVREVKLVFSTLAESFKFTGTTKKQKSAKINESFASKPVASTAPSKEVITESTNTMADRFKQLANIK
tara:strand:- start:1233 stop:2333 length:1101 start_codon:yes stop_codon:yes gene_type:complete